MPQQQQGRTGPAPIVGSIPQAAAVPAAADAGGGGGVVDGELLVSAATRLASENGSTESSHHSHAQLGQHAAFGKSTISNGTATQRSQADAVMAEAQPIVAKQSSALKDEDMQEAPALGFQSQESAVDEIDVMDPERGCVKREQPQAVKHHGSPLTGHLAAVRDQGALHRTASPAHNSNGLELGEL